MIKLNTKYNEIDFKNFLEEFLPADFVEKEEDIIINKDGRKVIEKAKILGFCESLDLYVLEMDHAREKDPRIAITADAFKILANHWIHRALVVFKNNDSENYRFSCLTISLDVNDRNKAVKKYSNARRRSFYLGANAKIKTAENFLIRRGRVENFDDLLERFNVEIVTREFYQNYKKLFESLLGHLSSDKAFNAFAGKHGLKLEIFAKKLLGQIVFIYFLQKKGWLGARRGEYISKGDGQFLRSIFLKCQTENKNFFNDYLEHLFYDCLNSLPKMAGSFYREKFDCQIPFLNGGLFEPINEYNWQDEFINIPNDIFSNNEGTGILDIFDLYNFTIDENTPDDQEVSVDPEMLGKVFENLLEDNVRKGQGAFYTPREIVQYMCRESLINYLVSNHSNLSEKNIREYVGYGEALSRDISELKEIWKGESFTSGQFKELDDLLKNAKIVDPACGSGAFLVGMLQEIIRLRIFLQLTPDSELFLESPDSIKSLSVYELKKETIQNSLYGVDIDPGAVDIAKLRFWLSIVVEEDVDEVEPLPNLDYKIMQGNSLLEDLVIGDSVIKFDFSGGKKLDKRTKEQKELFKLGGIQGKLILDQSDNLADKLEKLHAEFFNISNPENKKILKRKIDNIEDELIQSKCNEEIANAESLTANNPNDGRKILKNTERVLGVTNLLNKWRKDHLRPFFPWKLHFGEVFNRDNSGFDIVIANPPYIDSEGMVNAGQGQIREAIQAKFKWTKGNWDIYIAFFELGFGQLNQNGTLSFITPDKWISKPFGDELRKGTIDCMFILLKAGRKVFETAKVDSIISFFSKRKSDVLDIIDFKNGNFEVLKKIEKKSLVSPFALDHLFSANLDLLLRVGNCEKTLLDFGTCENACSTSDAYKLKPLVFDLKDDKFDSNKCLKIINTGTIGKFHSRWGLKQMTYLKDKYKFPVVDRIKFLDEFKNSYSKKSLQPKIIIKGLNLLDGYLDDEGIIIPGKTTLVITSENVMKLKFLLGLINSRLAFFYIKERYPASSYNQGIGFTKDMLNGFPVPNIKSEVMSEIVNYTENILTLTSSPSYDEDGDKIVEVKRNERLIDKVLYKLYNLTDGDIKIIEASR